MRRGGVSVEIEDRDLGWQRIQAQLRALAGSVVTIGVHDDAGKHADSNETVAQIAAIHEYGAPDEHIPQRSFLRSTFDESEDRFAVALQEGLGAVTAGTMPASTALARVGLMAQGAVRGKILRGIAPPLAPMTIEQREAKAAHGGGLQSMAGKHTPLVDSGQMLASIVYKVRTARAAAQSPDTGA